MKTTVQLAVLKRAEEVGWEVRGQRSEVREGREQSTIIYSNYEHGLFIQEFGWGSERFCMQGYTP